MLLIGYFEGINRNVINGVFFAAELLTRVLAGHLVTLENASAAEGNRLRRHCIDRTSMQ